MLLCLDLGNTHLHGGFFNNHRLIHEFRYPSKRDCTVDELGIFLKAYCKEIQVQSCQISDVALCSVVPVLDELIDKVFLKYFSKKIFQLRHDSPLPLKIDYQYSEIGADRIANALAAHSLYPERDVITVDLGTATTFEIITKTGYLLGGAIIPGLQLQMQALANNIACLPKVNIITRPAPIGKSSVMSIQSGLYYGQRGAIKEIVQSIQHDFFPHSLPLVIGTGGFSTLFEKEHIFDMIIPDLVLQGLRVAYLHNAHAQAELPYF